MLTEQERHVNDLLGQVFLAFKDLPVVHPHDEREFILAIHAAENIILARAGLRDIGLAPALEPVRRFIVVAENAQQFKLWCELQGVNPHAPNVLFVEDKDYLRGLSADTWELVVTGTPEKRPDWLEILDFLRLCGFSDTQIFTKPVTPPEVP